MNTTDFLVIGGGIIGISIARELKSRYPNSSICILEKEYKCGLHASGRNSGVLHAGFYYTADSFKARFTREGNKRLTEYCATKSIKLNKCGKLVVAQDESELHRLDELIDRAKKNRVRLESITEKEAKSIEPRVKTFQRALFSPTTSSVNPGEVVQAMCEDAVREGIQIRTGVRYLKKMDKGVIKTSEGLFGTGYLVNAAGLYADKIGQDFGFSEDFRILPFKGLYLYSDEPPGSLHTHIYPVSDLRNPFLGVHFTVTADGRIHLGPTAMPAFWREQYDGLANFNLSELAEILIRQAGLFLSAEFDFKGLAMRESQKYFRSKMVSLASLLAEGVEAKSYRRWGEPGIRAQLVNMKKRKLEMDFVIEENERSMHILNAVSPAFTCALPFAEYVCNRISG